VTADALAALAAAADPSRPLYCRPLGLVEGPQAQALVEAGMACPLAGAGASPRAWLAAAVAVRAGDRLVERVLPAATLRAAADADGRLGPDLAGWIARLAAPRPTFAGLTVDRPLVMGVINVTPDSFSDGGAFLDAEAAIERGLALRAAGADIVDVGGESTRPGSAPTPPDEQIRRVVPVVAALARAGAVVSIDTRAATVMAAAIAAGARIVNDVSALRHDPDALGTVARSDAGCVLMHMQGEPATMHVDPRYVSVVHDVYDGLAERVRACRAAGIPDRRLAVDPGIGFGKRAWHSLALIHQLPLLLGLGPPVLVGVSRKAFIGRVSRGEPSGERLPGSVAAGLAALTGGAAILRVHDVRATAQAIAVWGAVAAEGSALGRGPEDDA